MAKRPQSRTASLWPACGRDARGPTRSGLHGRFSVALATSRASA